MSDGFERNQTSLGAMLWLLFQIPVGFLYLVAGLFAPLWASIALWTVWTMILILAIAQRGRRPLITALMAPLALTVWVAAFFTVS